MRRMDRYSDENEDIQKRYKKNQELYHDVASNTKYTNITDVTNSNAFEINKTKKTYSSRESYQQMKKYQNVEAIPKVKKDLEDFNHIYKNHEKKVYDINSVLEEARKNRKEQDKLDEKRKLKNTSYNILADLNKEELEKYREERKKRIMTPEEEGLRELIDTIASKTLAGEIDKATSVDLLSDLMATNIMDKVDGSSEIGDKEKKEIVVEDEITDKSNEDETEEKSAEKQETENDDESKSINKTDVPSEKSSLSVAELAEIEKKKEEIDNNPEKLSGADKDFYTRSMDLSDQDFEMDDEFKDSGMPLIVKIIIVLLIVILIAVAAYFIYKKI